jgi:hypothetical protein
MNNKTSVKELPYLKDGVVILEAHVPSKLLEKDHDIINSFKTKVNILPDKISVYKMINGWGLLEMVDETCHGKGKLHDKYTLLRVIRPKEIMVD